MLDSIFQKVAELATLLKRDPNPTQVFSCEYRKTYRSTYFEKHLQRTMF